MCTFCCFWIDPFSCAYLRTCVQVWKCTCVCVYVSVCAYAFMFFVSVCMYVSIYVKHIYECVCVLICFYARYVLCTNACIHVFMYLRQYGCIKHTHIHICGLNIWNFVNQYPVDGYRWFEHNLFMWLWGMFSCPFGSSSRIIGQYAIFREDNPLVNFLIPASFDTM